MIPGISRDIEKRFGKIVQMVLEYRPDILCLQEVWTSEMKTWADGLLAPYFQYSIDPEEESKLVIGRYGSGLIMFSNLEVISEEFYIFTGKARTFMENILRRGYHLIKLKWRDTTLTLVNTHLTSFEKYEETRLEQLHLLNKRLADEAPPLLLAGDFNMVPGSKAYNHFTNQFNWNDLPKNDENTWIETNPYFDESEPNSRLDYFFGRGLKAVKYKVLPAIYSDHLAIYIQIKRKKPLTRFASWKKKIIDSIISTSRVYDKDLEDTEDNYLDKIKIIDQD
jgi:endonuclease/exonuclease/phosphatase family metal-dependent hydrolase